MSALRLYRALATGELSASKYSRAARYSAVNEHTRRSPSALHVATSRTAFSVPQICTIYGIINDLMENVMNVDTWAVVLATFFGPIAALLITFVRDSRAQKYNRRLHVFRTLMATRRIAISSDHVNALNLIEVDYYKCKKVEAAWKSYLDHLNNAGRPEDDAWRETKERRLAELLFQMGFVLGFKIAALDMFRGGYAPQGWAHKELRSNEVLEYFHEMAAGTKVFPIWLKGITPQEQQHQPPTQPQQPVPPAQNSNAPDAR